MRKEQKVIKTIIFPKQRIIDKLISIASASTCERSKCGSLIISSIGFYIGEGYNSMPCKVVKKCFKDKLPASFKGDRTCCVHAEQRAIMDALVRWSGLVERSTLWFLRLDANGKPEVAGAPWCTICSKMALDSGVAKFVLFHEEGWTSYRTDYYNQLSFEYGKQNTQAEGADNG